MYSISMEDGCGKIVLLVEFDKWSKIKLWLPDKVGSKNVWYVNTCCIEYENYNNVGEQSTIKEAMNELL